MITPELIIETFKKEKEKDNRRYRDLFIEWDTVLQFNGVVDTEKGRVLICGSMNEAKSMAKKLNESGKDGFNFFNEGE